jgi:hypothetical protein
MDTLSLNRQGLQEERVKAIKSSPILFKLVDISCRLNSKMHRTENKCLKVLFRALASLFGFLPGMILPARNNYLQAVNLVIADNDNKIKALESKGTV